MIHLLLVYMYILGRSIFIYYQHLEKHNILTHLQHGFRSGHSCETQLLLTTHDILQQYDDNTQVDLAILDFSKAFDTVPHKRLLQKLSHYGIRGELNNWIRAFLTNRLQSVIIEGISSGPAEVLSGVPQGTVLGPILFLCHINDLPLSVKSSVRMFADDCLLYSPIRCFEDHLKLQSDLVALDGWAAMWGMRFNAKKCYIMRISRKRSPSSFIYTLSNHPLEQVSQNPYLGVLLSENLKWAPHIDQLTKKANKTLGFLRRNLHMCSGKIKATAYKSLVQPLLEYSSTIWDPYLKGDITNIEAVQRRAARFVMKDHRRESSVTEMLDKLGWMPLTDRRRDARLVLLYKVVNGLVAIPPATVLNKKQSQYRTRANHSQQFQVFSPKTEAFRSSFFPRTVIEWNRLTEAQVTAPTVALFKTSLHPPFD